MTAAIDITTEQRKMLLALLRQFIPGVLVWAYGSRVKWTARPESDLDLVAFTTPAQRHQVSELKEALGESNLPFLVDFHVWDEVPERFHEIIRKENVVLQKAADNVVVQEGKKEIGGKGGEWATFRLGRVCSKIGSGATPRGGSSVYLDEGEVTLIRSQNVYNEGFYHDGLTYLTKWHASELANVEVTENDVLLNITGDSVARSCQVDPNVLPARVNQHVAIIRPDPTVLWPRFLRYYLVSPAMQAEMLSLAGTGATRNALTKGMIESFEILAPMDLPEQRAIAHILGTLDDKIELNRKMNETLEAMAQALFKSWFIDFDPVRAKAEGRYPCLPKEIADLFPSEFADSKLGKIPKGWRVEPVGDVVTCYGGGTPSTTEPKYWEGGKHHWTTPKDFSSLQAPILLETDRKITDAGVAKISSGLLPAGTLLLSSRAPVGYLAITAMPVAINQGFIAIKCNERASNFFMLNWCRANMDEIEGRATGTTFAEISKQNFRPILVVLPPGKLMVAFTDSVAPLYAKIKSNLLQNRALATLRDTLLPKLLSGEIRVKETEKFVEEIV